MAKTRCRDCGGMIRTGEACEYAAASRWPAIRAALEMLVPLRMLELHDVDHAELVEPMERNWPREEAEGQLRRRAAKIHEKFEHAGPEHACESPHDVLCKAVW